MHLINENVLDRKEEGRIFKANKTACAETQRSDMFGKCQK